MSILGVKGLAAEGEEETSDPVDPGEVERGQVLAGASARLVDREADKKHQAGQDQFP